MTDGEDVEVEEREDALWRLATSLAGSVTLHDVAEALVREGGGAAGGTFANLALLTPGSDLVRMLHHSSSGRGPSGQREVSIEADVPACEAIRNGLPVLLGSIDEIHRRYPDILGEITAAGLSARASVPLHAATGEMLGAIGIGWHLPQDFDAQQLRRLDLVAQLAALAVERSQIAESSDAGHRHALERSPSSTHADPQADINRLRLVTVIAERLVGSADRNEVFQRLTQVLVPAMADWCTICIPGDEELVRVAARHTERPLDDLVRRLVGSYPHRYSGPSPGVVVYRSGEPLRMDHLVEEINKDLDDSIASTAYGRTLRLLGDGFGLITPVLVDGEVQAVVTMTRRAGDGFSDEELAVLVEVASHVSVALVSAQHVENQHETALALQAAALPSSLPNSEQLHIAAAYRPASDGGQIGGDWYDSFELETGRIALVVGDVAGHGIGAAALTAQMRNVLRAHLFSGMGPLESLARLSHLIVRQEPDALATIVCAELDPATGRVTWASAGHPAPIVVSHPGHSVQLTGRPVPPIGCSIPSGSEEEREHHFTLERGARLIMFTDGLYERRRVDLDIGLAHLMILAELSVDRPHLGEACEFMLDGLLSGADEDDACLLVVHRQ
jgi:serine phosphatase RsbU (regulator of sigma subunit)